jgi:GNAT superfamily N-acetyltransferase
MTVEVVRLADHPGIVDQLAAHFARDWPEWYGPGGKGDARADLAARMNRDALPLGLVAVHHAQPIGTLTLSPAEVYEHPGFSPSLVGFWVRADLRNHGIGARLLRAVYDEARRLDVRECYAATDAAASLFLREGWVERDRFCHNGSPLTVFSRLV